MGREPMNTRTADTGRGRGKVDGGDGGKDVGVGTYLNGGGGARRCSERWRFVYGIVSNCCIGSGRLSVGKYLAPVGAVRNARWIKRLSYAHHINYLHTCRRRHTDGHRARATGSTQTTYSSHLRGEKLRRLTANFVEVEHLSRRT